MAEPFDDTAKAFYRNLFQGWGLKVETEYQVYFRSRSIDLVVECSEDDYPHLQNSVFDYFRRVNALELKGPQDPLTLVDFNLIMMRAWGLGAMERRGKTGRHTQKEDSHSATGESRALPGNRTVTIVCVTRPDHLLDDLREELGFSQTAEPGIYINEGLFPCRIIVPAELPLEERYYMLLPLARGRKLREFIGRCAEEGHVEYLEMVLDMGSAADPMMVWSKLLEESDMMPTMPDEVYLIIDQIVQKNTGKFPTIRQMLEEREGEGWRGGEHQGELKARQDSLLRMLTRKFGEAPAGMISRIQGTTDIAVLDGWLDRFVDASSLADMGIDGDAP